MTPTLVKEGTSTRIRLDICPYELIHDVMTGEDRELMIESLSCHDEIINHVVCQLVEGYTENGFSGTWATSRTTALQQAREKIALQYDYASKKTIEDMQRQIESLKKDVEYWRKEIEGRSFY